MINHRLFTAVHDSSGRNSVVAFPRGWMIPVIVAGMFASGCGQQAIESEFVAEDPESEFRPKVVATTTIVADLVANIAGDAVDLVRLMPPGTDPHRFTLTARDTFELRTADLIFYNGLNFAEKLESEYKELNERGVKTVAVTDGIASERIMTLEGGGVDPHVWGDPLMWMECVSTVVSSLKELVPSAADEFDLRGNSYRFDLKRLDNWIKEQVERVPWDKPRRRILVSNHNAFGYWARAYQFDVVSLQGTSTAENIGPDEIAKLTDYVKDTDLPVIFVETSSDHGPIQQVADDAKLKIGAEIYADSLGGDFAPTFKLRLLDVSSADELPLAGVGHIFLGRIAGKSLHIRVFNSTGYEIFDRAEREMSGNRARIASLKERLKSSWEKGYIVDGSEEKVVEEVKTLISYKPPAKNAAAGSDPGPEKALPLTGERIDVRTYIGMMKYNSYKIASGLKAGLPPNRLHEAAATTAERGLAPERSQ